LDYNKSQGISEKTLEKYHNALSFFKDFLERENIKNINEIKIGHIKKFLKWSKREILNYDINTRKEHLIALKKFFKYLYEKNYINNNIISDYITTYPL
jgi:site-specific recombinase XerD